MVKKKKGPGPPEKKASDRKVRDTFTITQAHQKALLNNKKYGWADKSKMVDGCIEIVVKLFEAKELDKWK